MKRLLLVGGLALSLAGCVRTIWVKDGATRADFNRDAYECERDARQSGYFGGGLIGLANMQDFMDRCMVARGYEKRVVR